MVQSKRLDGAYLQEWAEVLEIGELLAALLNE
jgi:hypothetical protein